MLMKQITRLVLSPLCLLATLSVMTIAHASPVYDACVDRQGTMNNTVVMGCSAEASEDAKKRMTKSYNVIYKRLSKHSPQEAEALEKAQLGWIDYRDNHCEFQGRYVGTPMYDYCPMQMNVARAEELEELAEMMEGYYP